jgi:hypothetical protein
MTYDSEVLDAIGWELLRYLQEDARVSFAELGRRSIFRLPRLRSGYAAWKTRASSPGIGR